MQELWRHSADEYKRLMWSVNGQKEGKQRSARTATATVNMSMGLGLTDAQVEWTAQRIVEKVGVPNMVAKDGGYIFH